MDEIELAGTLFTTSSRPRIYLDEISAVALNAWRDDRGIFTKWVTGLHPQTNHRSPILMPSATQISRLKNSDPVHIRLGIRPEVKGLGIKFIEVRLDRKL